MIANTEPRYAYIDALRGYAILMVIAVHASQQIGGLPSFAYRIADQGARGVQLFFVASAITLCMSWHRRLDGIASFYTRRLFRIAPMFWLAIVYFVATQGLAPRAFEPDGIGTKHIILTALFSHGFLPGTFTSVVPGGWSIAVEMMFYAVFPILVFTIKSWRTAVLAAAIALIPAAIVYWLLQLSAEAEPQAWRMAYQVFSTLNFVHQLPVFLIGIAAYFIMRDERDAIERRPFLLAVVALSPVAIVLVAYYHFHILWAEFGFHSSYAVAFAGAAIALSKKPIFIFVNPLIIWIGKISFSGYLFHLALYTVLPANLPGLSPIIGLFVFYGALTFTTIVASSVTYVTIEKPMIAFGNRLLRYLKSRIDINKPLSTGAI